MFTQVQINSLEIYHVIKYTLTTWKLGYSNLQQCKIFINVC